MAITKDVKQRIRKTKQEFDLLKKGKESLLSVLLEKELSELVYNSNAIEGSVKELIEKVFIDEFGM